MQSETSDRYTLDGKEVSPEELAGQSGALEIHFSIRENENCRGNSTLSIRLRELSRPEKVCGPALKRKMAHPGTDTGSAAG